MRELDVEWAEEVVNGIEKQLPEPPQFIPGRFPYTYAYDYMREHNVLGADHLMSRAECASLFRENDDKDAICEIFALAHCRQYGITIPVDFRFEHDS